MQKLFRVLDSVLFWMVIPFGLIFMFIRGGINDSSNGLRDAIALFKERRK